MGICKAVEEEEELLTVDPWWEEETASSAQAPSWRQWVGGGGGGGGFCLYTLGLEDTSVGTARVSLYAGFPFVYGSPYILMCMSCALPLPIPTRSCQSVSAPACHLPPKREKVSFHSKRRKKKEKKRKQSRAEQSRAHTPLTIRSPTRVTYPLRLSLRGDDKTRVDAGSVGRMSAMHS